MHQYGLADESVDGAVISQPQAVRSQNWQTCFRHGPPMQHHLDINESTMCRDETASTTDESAVVVMGQPGLR